MAFQLVTETLERNRDAGRCRIGCSAQTEAGPPGHQTEQHHGRFGGGRRYNRENYRPWAGQARTRRAC
jgi:hypothetical protein